jgi:hypothetical protein
LIHVFSPIGGPGVLDSGAGKDGGAASSGSLLPIAQHPGRHLFFNDNYLKCKYKWICLHIGLDPENERATAESHLCEQSETIICGCIELNLSGGLDDLDHSQLLSSSPRQVPLLKISCPGIFESSSTPPPCRLEGGTSPQTIYGSDARLRELQAARNGW